MNPWDEIIVMGEHEGILTALCRYGEKWFEVKTNEKEVLSLIPSPYKDGQCPVVILK